MDLNLKRRNKNEKKAKFDHLLVAFPLSPFELGFIGRDVA